MDQRPLIGVTSQTLQAIDHIPEGLPASWVMNRRYLDALAGVGGVPMLVPLFDHDQVTLRAIYDHVDGIFLPGGVDLDPVSYGSDAHDLCGRTDPPRDGVEMQLARWAMAEGKPVLGVCRGLQIINVVAGGTLHQDTTALYPGAIKHDYFPTSGYARDYLAHEARLTEDSRLARIFAANVIRINSMHHQGIELLGDGLVATAQAPDGLIEGIEGTGSAFLVGVQWHPEMLIDSDAGTRRLFEAFIEAAAAWRESRTLLGLSG
jgi:putative glutamine amidotransferase